MVKYHILIVIQLLKLIMYLYSVPSCELFRLGNLLILRLVVLAKMLKVLVLINKLVNCAYDGSKLPDNFKLNNQQMIFN